LITAWKDREGWLNFMFSGDSRVEDDKERNERRLGKSSWETGTQKISLTRKFTVPNTPGTSPVPAGDNTNTWSSKLHHAWCTPDFSYPLVSSVAFPSSFSISLSRPHLNHYHKNTLLSNPSLCLYSMIMSWHWVQHIPNTAFTVYSIHQVLHTLSIASTQVCLCSLWFSWITSWPLNVASASSMPPYIIDRHQTALHVGSKVTSHCHFPTVRS